MAKKLLRGGSALGQTLREHKELTRQELAEYLTEEIRLAPGSIEVACFCDDVTALKKQFDQTALRLERLLAKVGS